MLPSILCPECHTATPLTTGRCVACSADLSGAIQSLVTGAGLSGVGTAAPTLGATQPPRVVAAASHSTLTLGELFAGRYRIEKLLGAGGMGAVYKALDQELGIPIALKVIRSEVLSNPEIGSDFERRFKQELLLARQVTHQNVLRIHDLGESNGVKYITMPFVEGSDLHAILQGGHLPFDRVLTLARQITSGLSAAHDVGIVHRDLKPQNILVDAAGRAYISDFGLAKSFEASAAGLTRPGDFIGTPRYMAPESIEGQPVDHRSDLYALGLILYEMASGSTPFAGDSALEVLMQRVKIAPRRIEEVAPDLPPYFSRIVMRCLERSPNARYQTAREILSDLESATAPPSKRGQASVSITLPLPASRRGRMAAIGAAALIVALVAIPPVRHLWLPARAGTSQGLPSPSERKLMAVLPFKMLGATQNLDHVATGVAEALSAKLFGLNQVTVAPTSAIQGLDLSEPLPRIARDLGSNLLVTGSVQGDASRISIIVALEDPITPRTVWTKEFSGSPNDLLTLQDQIFDGLVQALDVTPTTEERARTVARPTENIAAYDVYLKGRNAMRGQQDKRNVEKAIDFYNQALALDPRFALAYAGLADASLQMYRETRETIWADKAVYAAQQGQRIDDSLLEVRVAAGNAYLATGKTNAAIAELQRALEISPNSDEAYRRLAAAYETAGRWDEAVKMHLQAIAKNPYYWVNHNALGATYFQMGQYDKAAEQFTRVIEIEPDNVNGYNDLGAAYLQTARYAEAADAFEKALKLVPTSDTWTNLGIAYAWMGQFQQALPAYQKAVDLSPSSDAWLSNLADCYRWVGNRQKAVETYDRAIALAYKALTVNPNNWTTRLNLGTYYVKKGDAAQGLKFITAALEHDASNPGYLYNLAVAHALTGDKPRALDALRKAFDAGYPAGFAKDDPDLRTLADDPAFSALLRRGAR
ncbi:MAG TPA: tetratricopeptide repeat protein [Gemmatimonadaceae bacterium]